MLEIKLRSRLFLSSTFCKVLVLPSCRSLLRSTRHMWPWIGARILLLYLFFFTFLHRGSKHQHGQGRTSACISPRRLRSVSFSHSLRRLGRWLWLSPQGNQLQYSKTPADVIIIFDAFMLLHIARRKLVQKARGQASYMADGQGRMEGGHLAGTFSVSLFLS